MNTSRQRDTILLFIMLVVIIGTFGLLYLELEVPNWLIGTIGTMVSGVIGLGVGLDNNGN